MKKNKNENFNFQLKQGFTIFISVLLFSAISIQSVSAGNTITSSLINEAIILSDKAGGLLNARINLDWEKMYNIQHPDFRKKISLDEMRYFEGWVASDYRKKAKQNAHISGAFVPTLDFIKNNLYKRDPLGFPVKRRYKWSEDPYLNIKTYSVKKISISTNRKYAKTTVMIEGRQRLNPAVVRGNFEFDAKYPLTDFWEKVDGEWVITLLSAPVNTSGAGILKYYVPNNKTGWEKTEFVEIDSADLKIQ